jgi:pyruvate-ferredoxin/flavodoxin oxidoreductase
MNQFGAASQGKLIEKKGVAEAMLSGHGSPFVAQASMANAANLYKAVLDGLTYRGTAFIQCYTSCQPEHGVPDSMSAKQARSVRDSRGMPEFISDPRLGETYQDSLTLKGNPQPQRDWYEKPLKGNKDKYSYTVAHWAHTEARFRRHFGKVPEDFKESMIPLEDILLRITQDDVVNRRFLDKNHRSFIPKFGVTVRGGRRNETGLHEPPDGLILRRTTEKLAAVARPSRNRKLRLRGATKVAQGFRRRTNPRGKVLQ